MLEKFRQKFRSKDNEPVLLGFVWMNDAVSRMIGLFAEKHMPDADKAVLGWRNRDGSIDFLSSDSMSEIETIGLLAKVEDAIRGRHGI